MFSLPHACPQAAAHFFMLTSSTSASAASLPLKMAPSMLARYFCLV
jgi:hypothetical protein